MKHEKYPILVNQIIAFQIQKSMIHFFESSTYVPEHYIKEHFYQ